jgi:hypothetical protein
LEAEAERAPQIGGRGLNDACGRLFLQDGRIQVRDVLRELRQWPPTPGANCTTLGTREMTRSANASSERSVQRQSLRGDHRPHYHHA